MDYTKKEKLNNGLSKYFYPIVLFLYPFWNVNEGVDWMDVGYNLGNFAFWDKLGNTWKLSTYLSNVLGRFFYKMPGGDTLLGMNCYTTLLISALALLGYWFSKRYLPAWAAFGGNILAISLCWCPTAKLYDYLTYLLLMLGIVFLFQGLLMEKKSFLILAGFFLGVNVFTRIPNVVEVGFIILVWYYAYLQGKTIKETGILTGWCLLGYLSGILLLFAIVCAGFGWDSYVAMLNGMLDIEASTNQYSFFDLLTGAWKDYARSLKWVVFYGAYILAGEVFFRLGDKIKFIQKFEYVMKILYLLGMVILYRFFWGRGMFDLNYYSYGVIFWPTALFLVWSLGICFYRLMGTDRNNVPEKLLTMLVFLVILITPLGSNNKIYPIMNNLFLVAPFIFVWTWKLFPKFSYSMRATIRIFFLFFVIQSMGFGLVFTFGDGSYEEKRDTKIENNGILYGIYTSSRNAQTIEELTSYVENLEGETSALTYGNIPALCYYLNIEPAIGSTWSDLQSYSMKDFARDFKVLEQEIETKRPIIILNSELDREDRQEEKYLRIMEFMEKYHYSLEMSVNNMLVYH